MSSAAIRGNFNALNLPQWDREMIESAYQAVESVPGGWDFLKTYDPGDGGFMFSTPPPKMVEIDKAVNDAYGGHSGASYGCTMRTIQFIARYGWETYARDMLKQYGPPPAAAPVLQQAATVDRFINSLPANTSLTSFADAIQKDAGMRQQIPDIDEQADALRRFAEGKMSYAEMRSLCG